MALGRPRSLTAARGGGVDSSGDRGVHARDLDGASASARARASVSPRTAASPPRRCGHAPASAFGAGDGLYSVPTGGPHPQAIPAGGPHPQTVPTGLSTRRQTQVSTWRVCCGSGGFRLGRSLSARVSHRQACDQLSRGGNCFLLSLGSWLRLRVPQESDGQAAQAGFRPLPWGVVLWDVLVTCHAATWVPEEQRCRGAARVRGRAVGAGAGPRTGVPGASRCTRPRFRLCDVSMADARYPRRDTGVGCGWLLSGVETGAGFASGDLRVLAPGLHFDPSHLRTGPRCHRPHKWTRSSWLPQTGWGPCGCQGLTCLQTLGP